METLREAFSGLHWVDYTGLGVVVVFLALGYWRGLWWQVLRLAGLTVAVAVARWLGPVWGEEIGSWAGLESDVAAGLGWFSAFLVALVIAAFLGMVGGRAIEAMKLSLINRTLGAVAGLVTGALLHCAVAWGCSSFASAEWQAEGLQGTYTGMLVAELKDRGELLPVTF